MNVKMERWQKIPAFFFIIISAVCFWNMNRGINSLNLLREVPYLDNIRKVLQFSMRMERQGEDFYRYYAGKINDARTGKLFEQLADMEREHYNILKERFDALGGR